MNTKYTFTLLAFLCSFYSVDLKAQLNITDNQTAAVLAQKLAGTGVIVSNATLTCPGNANGIFTVVSSTLGLDSGIVLTSGQAVTAGTAIGINGPANASSSTTTVNSSGGDADLAALAQVATNDKCILEFDFVPAGDTIKFDYIFGSEEYPEFACGSVNDVFGFFISGPGITGPYTNNSVNIALIPGTNIPVTVNSVNSAPIGTGPISICQAMGPGSPFNSYYVDNIGSTTVMYDGLTTTLTAIAAVTPCTTYHLKLAIADGGDHVYDSGVFLKAGSLSSPAASISKQYPGPNGLDSTGLNYAVRGCLPGEFIFRRPVPAPQPLVVDYLIQGTAVNGIDYQMIADSVVIPANQTSASVLIQGIPGPSPSGPLSVKLVVLSYACSGSAQTPIDSAELNLYDAFIAEIYNKDTIICEGAMVQLNAMADSLLLFSWTPAELLDNPNIINPVATIMNTTKFTISATFPGSGCPPTQKSFTAFVEPVDTKIMPDTALCLTDPMKIRVTVKPEDFPDFTYAWAPSEGLSDPDVKEPFFWVNGAGTYTYNLTVKTPKGCIGRDTIEIVTRPATILENVTENFTVKYGQEYQLNAQGAMYYTWSPARLLDYPTANDPKVRGFDSTTFTVIGMNFWGCKDTAYVKMDIDYGMLETLPSAFSPNNDGRNDFFRLGQMKYQRLIEFRVFNRWGQELYSTTDATKGWDGTYKGVPQEVGVYHYLIRVTTPDGKLKTVKGDVTLIR